MKKFDCLVTIGDSWTWGNELPEDQREKLRWSHGLAKQLNLPEINLSVPGSSNFCKKWHLLNWTTNTKYNSPLVIVGLTDPSRQLLYDNSKDFFQEDPGHLVSEDIVCANWGNSRGNDQTKEGGFGRHHTSGTTRWSTPVKEDIQKFFYKYMYNDKVGEINTIWEIKLLNGLITDLGGQAIFWSNFYRYNQIDMPWSKTILHNYRLVNNLEPFPMFTRPGKTVNFNSEYFKGCNNHPNAQGHAYIQQILYQYLVDSAMI